MSNAQGTRDGLKGVPPGREAVSSYSTRRQHRRGGGEQPTVPEADFRSYYGKPVINKPVWSSPDIPGYLFLGGLAGAASLLGAAADVTGQRDLSKVSKTGAAAAGGLALVALVHDLGMPKRFLHMLRVFKVTSPMSVGSWLLGAYVPTTMVAAACQLAGRLPRLNTAATAGAALMGPAVASYTGALISDTAVPAWHDAHREMPYIFVGSGAMAAGGLGLLAAPQSQHSLPREIALVGALTEFGVSHLMEKRLGMVAEPYQKGRSGKLMRAGQVLGVVALASSLLGRRSRVAGAVTGAALMASSAATRFGIFFAGLASAEDPRYTVQPQRQRVEQHSSAATSGEGRVSA